MTHQDNFERKPTEAEIEVAIQELVKMGSIKDSGLRRWSNRTRSFQTVWVTTEFAGRTLH